VRYVFIAENQAMWPVTVLCEVLGVSRSGFYAYLARDGEAIDADEMALIARVKAIHRSSGGCYGSRRMAKALQAEGFVVGRYRAGRLMKKAGVSVLRRTSRRPQTTESDHRYQVAPNELARQFDVVAPNVAWAGDITYLWTQEGWLYLAVLLDLYSRKVGGWAMSDQVNTALVSQALKMAVGRRQPVSGLLHHTDRGSQYASHAYRDQLRRYGMICSMSGRGECLDNAVAERFFGSLKRERTSQRDYETRQEARDDVMEYIEMFYNSRRLHSYLGYMSPNEYERITVEA
jgi:transposase InsO family protein